MKDAARSTNGEQASDWLQYTLHICLAKTLSFILHVKFAQACSAVKLRGGVFIAERKPAPFRPTTLRLCACPEVVASDRKLATTFE